MFTAQEYQTVIDRIEENNTPIYSVQKNAYSYYLRQLSNDARGEAVEELIANRLKSWGQDTRHLGGLSPHDIEIVTPKKIVRVECKSAVLQPGNKYVFEGIKLNCFDTLYVAFVHPVEGVIVKSIGKHDLEMWILERNIKPVDEVKGYKINVPSTMLHKYLTMVSWENDGQLNFNIG